MTISYHWLSEYLPQTISPENLSTILTSIGLEVESLEKYENFKGGLAGLVVGEVLETVQHPNADKLKLTKVNIGTDTPLNISLWSFECSSWTKSSGGHHWYNYLSKKWCSINYETSKD
jgi:hypothetical protein